MKSGLGTIALKDNFNETDRKDRLVSTSCLPLTHYGYKEEKKSHMNIK